jgi:YfiR/HmsC-like
MDVLSPHRHRPWRGLAHAVVGVGVLATLLVGAQVIWAPRAVAQSEGLAEYQVKAAFLFNFAKFVDWPEAAFADARAPIVLGVVGENPFGDDLSNMVSRQQVKGRPIRVGMFKFGDDLRGCHVVFVSASERAHVPQILSSLRGADALTVSDIDGFAAAGGVMQFVIEDSRVRFVVNQAAAEQAKLRISAKLLALARMVSRTDVRGGR